MGRFTKGFRFVGDDTEDHGASGENTTESVPVERRRTPGGNLTPAAEMENDEDRPAAAEGSSRGSVLMFRARGPAGLMLDIRRMDHRRFLKKILAAIMGN